MSSDPLPRGLGFARVLALLSLLATAEPALAETAESYAGRTPPRLSLIDGQVSYWHTGETDWEEAQVNLPLGPGDYVATAADGRAEMQIGPRAFLRLASQTQVGIVSQDGGLLRLDVPQGRLALDLRALTNGARIEVQTPQGKLSTTEAGLYDITVAADRVSFISRQGGHGTVFTRYDAVDLRANSEVVTGDAVGGVATSAAPPPDEWSKWNSERTDRILSAASRGNVSEDIYGVSDLDSYGTWREEPEYGRVWVPANVGPTWAPYTTGRWLWDGDYGWSWVDASPWGWAPYHYGRWVWINSYWGWAPGPVYATPIYSPALVAFFGGSGFSVGIGVGVPFVSWVALGWGEPVYPWWGPSWYRGRPCWNGWGNRGRWNHGGWNNGGWNHGGGNNGGWNRGGGPHYRNQDVPNAVAGARREDFARRTSERIRVDAADQRRLHPVRSGLPVEPSEAGVRQARERTRPPRPDGVEVARSRPPSRYGETQERGRDAANLPGSRFGGQPKPPGMTNGERPNRAERPLPPSAPSRAERPLSAPTRQRAMDSMRNDTADRDLLPRRSVPVQRDSFAETRPRSAAPERPLRDKPSRPVQDAYAAPSYQSFDRVPRQREVPSREMPGAIDRPRAPRVDMPSVERPQVPRVEQPSVSTHSEAPAAPRPRSGGDFGGPRFQGSPSMAMPSRPQMGGGGSSGGGGGSSAPSGGGGHAPRAMQMPGGGAHPRHGR